MGLLKRSLGRKSGAPQSLEADRRITRFHRLVEQHRELLDLFSDLKDKQSGEYILDRQYIEAQLDRAYEGGRRILYDMHVISHSDGEAGYEALDRVRAHSEEIMRQQRNTGSGQDEPEAGEDHDWEIRALREIYDQLTGIGGKQGAALSMPEETVSWSLAEWLGWAHAEAAQKLADRLPSLATDPVTPQGTAWRTGFCFNLFPLGGMRRRQEEVAMCLERGPSEQEVAVDLLPLCYFLEGLAPLRKDPAAAAPAGASPGQDAPADVAECLHLHVGEGFLLLQLPPWLPLRLFLCSLSVQEAHNLFYLFGSTSSSMSAPVSCRLESAMEPFPSYFSNTRSGAWINWASGFTWAQGEERLLTGEVPQSHRD